MPDSQLSEPEFELLSSATSTSHTPASEPRAKVEPCLLPNQILEATQTHVIWPVPHIMVYYGEMEYAYGRRAIADMGERAFLEWMYRRHVWTPKTLSYGLESTYQAHDFERSKYAKKAYILGTFYHIHGEKDTGPVKLGALGWAEMIQNVVKLELVYDGEAEEVPQAGMML